MAGAWRSARATQPRAPLHCAAPKRRQQRSRCAQEGQRSAAVDGMLHVALLLWCSFFWPPPALYPPDGQTPPSPSVFQVQRMAEHERAMRNLQVEEQRLFLG